MPGYRVSKAAAQDLHLIDEYTKNVWGAERATSYMRSLAMALSRLAASPRIGRRRDDLMKDLRSFRIGNHIAYYTEKNDGIAVVRILHPSMNVERQFKRD